ncbi:TPA: hypothetical protein N5N76_004890 [Enterobacter asburiae]|uniref:hypothetical protein n=1 Tax=Enterobacter asburiae TaxID=61645 RepID=UPI001BCFD7EF|nr:hypothetical protein [Enterobacter asburiae]EHN8902449.1 hypothetical protein [Enterobacter asburiae]EHN8906727.1 hypothetical protein [Enterobacter asburiae]MCK7283909.1 hypothetical protein [Enterobacter asburiae]MCK7403859.1 hypothetical protein [Enterobacter asburiae]HCM9421906.1 hypothetical protein [Enterobacter asburiae]
MKYFLLALLSFCSFCFASKYPIITSLQVSYNAKGADYYITQKVVEIGPAGDQLIGPDKYVALVHKHYNPDGTYTANYENNTVAIYSKPTPISEMAMLSYNAQGKNVTRIGHAGANGFPECVAYAAYDKNTRNWDTAITPGGCMMVPPAEQWCKITSPEITLEHGAITLKQAEGDTASTSLGVQCTTETAVTFNLITNDKYIYLDEGKSEITVDNMPLNSKIDLPQGDSQMPVKDLLTGITKEGYHTGSSVLVMMPY